MKNEEGFLDVIEFAVAEYCDDNNDKNFETTVHITANDGWVKASKIEEECNKQTSDVESLIEEAASSFRKMAEKQVREYYQTDLGPGKA